MPQMNGTGPDGHGPGSGRGLGRCSKNPGEKSKYSLGTGLGKRRHAGENQQLVKSREKKFNKI